jgi:hypothetical protein
MTIFPEETMQKDHVPALSFIEPSQPVVLSSEFSGSLLEKVKEKHSLGTPLCISFRSLVSGDKVSSFEMKNMYVHVSNY